MRELDVPASRPAFHAPGPVLALRYFAETSRGRLMVDRRDFRRSGREPVLALPALLVKKGSYTAINRRPHA
jgi:hypothetical protein